MTCYCMEQPPTFYNSVDQSLEQGTKEQREREASKGASCPPTSSIFGHVMGNNNTFILGLQVFDEFTLHSKTENSWNQSKLSTKLLRVRVSKWKCKQTKGARVRGIFIQRLTKPHFMNGKLFGKYIGQMGQIKIWN